MPDDDLPAPEPTPAPQLSPLGGLAPDELFARAMQTVKMTGGNAGAWQPPTVEECAQLFPGYEVLRLLGRGGMGAVYQARQIELDRLVAIKLLPLEISVDKDFADRFRREARAMAKLNHPNIITVYDFGTTREGHLFFVMEYVEGANLADIIHQVGLEPDQTLSIAEQVCIALAYAHNKGIIHRDIKPANVMVDTESHVKVADFGLARLTDPSAEQLGHTMTGTVMGTPDYMAPEQGMGMNVDHRADIYSLGVMIYEMMCRQVPKGIFDPPSHRTGCDARIDGIVIKAMQQSPERRYQSTQEMRNDITTARTPLPTPPPATGASPRKPRPVTRPGVPGAPPRPPQKPPTPITPKPSPVPPETMVMQAVKPPAPAPARKSKLPLYAGIGAGVAALAVAAFLFTRPEKLTKAQIYAREHAGEQPPDDMALARATKDIPFVNTLGMKFVPVPGADILMCIHETRRKDYAAYAAAVPGVDGTWKDPVIDGKPLAQTDDHPVVLVSWEDATAFCEWLSKKEHFFYRLPNEHEWNLAVVNDLDDPRAISSADLAKKLETQFPWGTTNEKDASKFGNYRGKEDGYEGTAPVMSFQPNHWGIYDLGGNAWEWCNDLFKPGGTARVLRGCGYDNWGPYRKSSTRESGEPNYRQPPTKDVNRRVAGFRVVVAIPRAPASVTDVGTRSSVSQTAPSAATPRLSPSSESWVDAMNNGNLLKAAVKEGPALRMTDASKGLYIDLGPEIKDGAVRMLFTADASVMGQCAVQVHRTPGFFYNLNMEPDFQHIGLGIVENGAGHSLKSFRLPVEAQRPAGQPIELELRMVGAKLVAKVNGVEAFRFEDNKLAQGHLAIRLDPGVLLHAVQTLDWSKGGAAPLPASAYGWIDLLPLIDVKRDTVDGNWRLVNGVLNGDGSFARLVLPYVPPEEYDFRIRFTRQSGNLAVSQHLAGPKQDVMWIMGGWSNSASGLEQVNGAKGYANATSLKSGLENGRRYESIVKVRRDRVQVELDGQPVVDYKTDWSDFSMNPKWSFPDAKKLGVGCQQPTVFHSIEVHPEGAAQAAADAGAAAAAKPPGALGEGASQSNAVSKILIGTWRFTWDKNEWTGLRSFKADGTFTGTGNGKGTLDVGQWTILADRVLVSYSDGETDQMILPLDPKNTQVIGKRSRQLKAVKEQAEPAILMPGLTTLPPANQSTPATATKDTPFENTLGMKFVPVPITGGPTNGQLVLFSVWDTRVQDYEVFVKETKREWPKVGFEQGPTHPAVNVSWDDAQAFCVWLTERERKAGRLGGHRSVGAPAPGTDGAVPSSEQWVFRLPSDHEWSCAVGIGDREDAAKLPNEKQGKINDVFPWGTQWPPPAGSGNFAGEELHVPQAAGKFLEIKEVIAGYNDGFVNTSPVGSFAVNRFGLYDMGGNVFQWCEDWFDKGQKERVLRSSSWANYPVGMLRSSYRGLFKPEWRFPTTGFRCVLAPAGASDGGTRSSVSPSSPEAGFRALFDGKTLTGWRSYPSEDLPADWRVADGAILGGHRSYLVTKEMFGDFELRLEWKVGSKGNGGIFFRMPPGEGSLPRTAPEFQLCAHDDPDKYKTGALYNVLMPSADVSLPEGQWNTARLVVQGNHVEHWVNDQFVRGYELQSDYWKERWKAGGFANVAGYAQATQGWIGLQGWNGEVAYRNIRIRPLKQ